MPFRKAPFACALLAAALLPLAASAAPPDSLLPRRATLAGWHDLARTALYDRRGSYGGLFHDRGTFRRLTPRMDHEYGLDVYMDAFTPEQDFSWYAAQNGFRLGMGSIDKSHLVTRSHVRLALPLAGRHHGRLDAIQEESLSGTRLFAEVGYQYEVVPGHRVGFSQTVGAYKPDLDATLSYEYGHLERGFVRAELALLDAYNDFIFDRIGVDPALEDTTRSYAARPVHFSVHAASPVWRGLRGEVAVGTQRPSRARVSTQSRPDLQFDLTERAGYAGLLAEYAHPALTAGLTFTETFSRYTRRAPAGTLQASDYTTRQTDRTWTGYLLAPVWKLSTELWLSREVYRDAQTGRDFDQSSIPVAFSYREAHTLLRLGALYLPERRGVRGGLEFFSSDRRFDPASPLMLHYLRFPQHSPNRRLAFHVGYQFRPGVYAIIGGAYDVDGDTFYSDRGRTGYDSAFGRIVTTW